MVVVRNLKPHGVKKVERILLDLSPVKEKEIRFHTPLQNG
jgi:hypothetical protein